MTTIELPADCATYTTWTDDQKGDFTTIYKCFLQTQQFFALTITSKERFNYLPTMWTYDALIILFMMSFWTVSIGIYLMFWGAGKLEQDTLFPEQKSPWIEFELPSFITTVQALLGDSSGGMIRID